MENWISEGLIALMSGMSAVFLILILISVIISSLKHIHRFEKKATQVIASGGTGQSPPPVTGSGVDEDEQRRIVAAITVALAQELNVSADRLIIRRLRRL